MVNLVAGGMTVLFLLVMCTAVAFCVGFLDEADLHFGNPFKWWMNTWADIGERLGRKVKERRKRG